MRTSEDRLRTQVEDHAVFLAEARARAERAKADVALCPRDCVTHDAVGRVRQFCKRHGKRLVFLPRASLSAFARAFMSWRPDAPVRASVPIAQETRSGQGSLMPACDLLLDGRLRLELSSSTGLRLLERGELCAAIYAAWTVSRNGVYCW